MSVKYSGTFAITATPQITVTNPTSSSVIYVGDTVNIAWTTQGTVGWVKIEVFNGTNLCSTLTTQTPNDGSFTWNVKGSHLVGSSSNYKIKISETDGSPSDYSSAFTAYDYILKAVTEGVTFPGEDFDYSLYTFKKLKTVSEGVSLTDVLTEDTRTWKHRPNITEGATLTESFVAWQFKQKYITDSTSISDTLTEDTRTWKHIKPISEGATLSDVLTEDTRTWKHVLSSVDATALTESFVQWLIKPKEVADGASLSDTLTENRRTWKHQFSVSDGVGFPTEVVTHGTRTWEYENTSIENILYSADSVEYETRTWKFPFLKTDGTTLTESLVHNTRTWKHMFNVSDGLSYTEVVAHDTRTWKHMFTPGEGLSFSEVIDTPYTRTWKHKPVLAEGLSITETIDTPYTRTWKKNPPIYDGVTYTDTMLYELITPKEIGDTLAFTDSFEYVVKTWHRKINEVLAFAERYGPLPFNFTDGVQYLESIKGLTVKNSIIKQFHNNPTESYGTLHKTGWFATSDSLTNSRIIRRLNIEYNSADPVNVKMYVDGDDVQPSYTHTLPAATSEETTNKSLRVSRRAKNFMLELATAASTNPNVTIEDIEVEIDG
jgi:hypothetical protein